MNEKIRPWTIAFANEHETTSYAVDLDTEQAQSTYERFKLALEKLGHAVVEIDRTEATIIVRSDVHLPDNTVGMAESTLDSLPELFDGDVTADPRPGVTD